MLLFDSLVLKCVFDTWDGKMIKVYPDMYYNPIKADRGICFLFSTSQFKPSKNSWWLCWFTILGRSMFQFLPYQDLGGEASKKKNQRNLYPKNLGLMIHNLRERKYFFQMAGQIIATIHRPQRWFSKGIHPNKNLHSGSRNSRQINKKWLVEKTTSLEDHPRTCKWWSDHPYL